jgi:hypothetical protein
MPKGESVPKMICYILKRLDRKCVYVFVEPRNESVGLNGKYLECSRRNFIRRTRKFYAFGEPTNHLRRTEAARIVLRMKPALSSHWSKGTIHERMFWPVLVVSTKLSSADATNTGTKETAGWKHIKWNAFESWRLYTVVVRRANNLCCLNCVLKAYSEAI